MKIFFAAVTLLCSLLLDLLAGNLGFSLSLSSGVLLYLYAGSCGKAVFPLAVICGMFLDMCYSRPAAFSSLVILLAVTSGVFFIPDRERRGMLLRSLPAGAITGGFFVLGNAAVISCMYGKSGYPSSVLVHFIASMLFGVFAFPIQIIILDAVSQRLHQPVYLTGKSTAASTDDDLVVETVNGRGRIK